MNNLREKLKEIGIFRKQRYWSIMLVGEHGRIIPVRRFKAIALSVAAIALFSSLALVVLGFMHVQRERTIDHLQSELERLQQHTSMLRDEKDIMKARMVIGSLQSAGEPNSSGPEKQKRVEPKSAVQESSPLPKNLADSDKITAEQSTPQKTSRIQWKADIRQLDIRYDAKDQSLKAQYVIHNMSKPKEMLSGSTVLVLKSGDDPSNWISIPRVPLTGGKPSARGGHAFSVKNYRTLGFATSLPKAPETSKTASVYVFLEDGELVFVQDFDVKVISNTPAPEEKIRTTKAQPPAPEQPIEAKSTLETLEAEGEQEASGGNDDQEAPEQAIDLSGDPPPE